MNKKAIAVYLDNSDKMEIEFSWLHKTWLLWSLEEEYDLVVFYNPDAIERVKKFQGIKAIEMPYMRLSGAYKFLNSHYFCLDDKYNQHLKSYEYLMKTDCDVFLTERMRGFVPSKFIIGQGGYYEGHEETKNDYIKNLSKKLNLNYNGLKQIGATFFGKTRSVINVTANQSIVTESIITTFSRDEEFKNSGFQLGIASMIAGEIVVNHIFSNQHVCLHVLDSKCWQTTKIGSDILHIHAWHTDQKWSKHSFFKNEYTDWIINSENAFLNAGNYCQFIATISYEELFKLKKLYKSGNMRINYGLFEDSNPVVKFVNDGNVEIKLLNEHKYNSIFSTRVNKELTFRKINYLLIKNGIIKNNFIDLGAWIGDNALPWAKLISGKIYAIDPSPTNCKFIKDTAELNGIKNIELINSAISDVNKVISTLMAFGEDLYHATFQGNENGDFKINSYSLDHFYEEGKIENIGYIHLDVEGMEFDVVKGSAKIIEEFKPIISFEQHIESDDYKGLSKHLIEKGYRVWMIDEILPGCNPDCRNFLAFDSKDSEKITELINSEFKNKNLLIEIKP